MLVFITDPAGDMSVCVCCSTETDVVVVAAWFDRRDESLPFSVGDTSNEAKKRLLC